MVREKYGVRLTPEQRNQLEHLVRAGKSAARVTTRARILLKTDAGLVCAPGGPSPGCGRGHGVPHQAPLCRGGISWRAAKPAPGQPAPEVGRPGEAHLVALACSPAPEGHDH